MQRPSKADEHGGKAGLWLAEPPRSELRFALRHMVVGEIAGRAERWRASLLLDPEQPARSWVEAIIDAGSLQTGAEQRDAHIRSAEFLDVVAFPEIRFRSNQVRPMDDGRYQVKGDLTIRDVTREVTLIVEQHRPVARPPQPPPAFTARASLDRQAFGLHWNQDLDGGGVIVGDLVDVEIRIEPRQAG